MEVINIFVNYGISDFKQNPMSETDFNNKKSCQGVPVMHVNGVNGLLGNILSKLKAAQTSGR